MIRNPRQPSYNEVIQLVHHLLEQEQQQTMTTLPRAHPLSQQHSPITSLVRAFLWGTSLSLGAGALFFFISVLQVDLLSIFGLLRLQTGLLCLGLLLYCLKLLAVLYRNS